MGSGRLKIPKIGSMYDLLSPKTDQPTHPDGMPGPPSTTTTNMGHTPRPIERRQ